MAALISCGVWGAIRNRLISHTFLGKRSLYHRSARMCVNRASEFDDKPTPAPNIEVTPEMIEAGTDAVLSVVGGADLGGLFSASELAVKVYLAMYTARAT